MKRYIAAAGLAFLTLSPSHGAADAGMVGALMETDVKTWLNDPVLVDAINAQNQITAGYTQADIDAADTDWRTNVTGGGSELIYNVMTNEAAEFLRNNVRLSAGLITEVFIMDAHGLNVAASQPTSDYWQGDEAKYSETYLVGPGAVHVSEIEFDESTQSNQVQMSFTITDPSTGAAIGAITVGIIADAL